MNGILVKIYGPNDKWKRLFWKKNGHFKTNLAVNLSNGHIWYMFLDGLWLYFWFIQYQKYSQIKKHFSNTAVAQIDRWIRLKMTYIFYESYLLVFSEVKARRKNQREARKAAAEQMIQRIQQELECAKLI